MLSTNKDITKDLKELYKIGNKISFLNKEIENSFTHLSKYNLFDREVKLLYYYYCIKILNKNDIYKEEDFFKDDASNGSLSFQEDDYGVNINHTLESVNKENKILIVSGNKNNFGIITQISLCACSLFGFTNEEICGQDLNTIIPEIIHKVHPKVLSNTLHSSPFHTN